MYVCICNAVTENDIGSAIAGGCCSLGDLREQLGVGTCCGRCTGCARDVLIRSLHTHPSDRVGLAGTAAAAA